MNPVSRLNFEGVVKSFYFIIFP